MIWPIFTSGVLFHVVYVVVDGKSYRCTKAEWELSGDTCYFVAGGLTSNLKEAKRYCKSLIKKKSTMAMVDSEDDMKALARSASKQNGIHQVWLDGSNTKKEKPGAFVWHDATLTPIDKTATPWGIGKDGNPFPHPKHNNEWITLAFKDNGDVSGLEHGMGDLVGILKTRQPDHAGYACMAPAVPEADMRMHLRFQENNKH